MVILRHHESGKMDAGLLVPDAPVVILHLQHPFDVPADLIEDVGRTIAAFGKVEADGLELLTKHLPGPQQRAGRDSGIDHVAAIVAGIVPAADVVPKTLPARGRMKFAFEVTGWMRVSGELGSEVHRSSAALTVESSHREIVDSRVKVRPNRKIPAAPHAGDIEVVASRFLNRREVGRLNHVAR